MKRIRKVFEDLKKGGAFIPYVVAGDPSIQDTLEIVDVLVSSGADIIELGLPFSDPIADGPTIQRAAQRSLEAGMNTDKYFELVAGIRQKHDVPLVCMTYYNLLVHRGLARFAEDAASAGIDGLIIPDLPVEEAGDLLRQCRENNIDLIFIAAPTTTSERLARLLEVSTGFLYIVSLLGVTGARDRLSDSVKPLVEGIRAKAGGMPLAVGFGISKPAHVKQVIKAGADAAIVGSAIVSRIEDNISSGRKPAAGIGKYASSLSKAAHG